MLKWYTIDTPQDPTVIPRMKGSGRFCGMTVLNAEL